MTFLSQQLSNKRGWISAVMLSGVLLFFHADPVAFLTLSLGCFWLAVLPGTLIIERLLERSLTKLETWFLGTALGINLIPVLFTILTPFSDSSPPLWIIVGILISVLNGVLLLTRKKEQTSTATSTAIPLAWLTIVIAVFLTAFQFQHLGRTSDSYYYSVYYGADVSNIVAFVECFLRSTHFIDYHTNGAPVTHHDFLFRFVAGLHFFFGRDIYDSQWFWLEPFSYVLLLGVLYLFVRRLTGSTLAAWLGILFFMCADNYGKQEVFFTTVSDTYRYGLLEAILALLFLADSYSLSTEKQKRNALWLLFGIAVIGLRWKATFLMVLIPCMLLSEFIQGYKNKKWRRFTILFIAAILSGIQAIIIFSPSVAIAGQSVIGRPLLQVSKGVEALLFHSISLKPVSPIGQITFHTVLSILIVLPFFFAASCVYAARYLLLAIGLKMKAQLLEIPRASLLIFTLPVMGLIVRVFQSPMHYVYGDQYQGFFGLVLGLPLITIVLARAIQTLRDSSTSGTHRSFAVILLLLGLVDLGYGFRGYRYVNKGPWGSRPVQLVEDLRAAGDKVPVDEKIITRRYDLTGTNSFDSTLANFEIIGTKYHDRNHEFYGADLARVVIQEGPDDNLVRAAAVVQSDSERFYVPNEELKADLWRRIALIDSVYDSKNASTVLWAARQLHSSYILIDHTIRQSLDADLRTVSDTIFAGKTVTLLKLK